MTKKSMVKMNKTEHTRWEQFRKNMWKHRALLLFILPGFILIVLWNYIPLGGLILAFKSFNYRDGLWHSPWIGLRNFSFLFKSPNTVRMVRNTVGYFFLFLAAGTLCNVALAIALNECRRKYFSRLSQTVMIIPTFISYTAVTFIVKALLQTDGVINGILEGLGGRGISFYTSPQFWPWILLVVNLWKSTGYGSVIYLSALAGMDQEIFEAAEIDGANSWQKIWYLTLPMLTSMISIMTLMSLGGIMSSNTGLFYQVTLNVGALYPTTQTLDSYVLSALVDGAGGTMGQNAAVTFFQSVVGSFMVITVNLIVKKISPENSLF